MFTHFTEDGLSTKCVISSSTHEKNEEVNVETEKEHYRKRLNFRGPKTHENKPKPTKIEYFRRPADENSRRK